MKRLHIGISTCPNDTFAFHGLLAGEVRPEGVDELVIELSDVERLNERMLAGEFDVCKVSFHAALAMAERVLVLPSGSALGFGVGPLLLHAAGRTRPEEHPFPPRVLCPGRWTTATLLWRLFHPATVQLEQVVFSKIMPALVKGEADFGVCIHEGRFTYRDLGLGCVEDLGERWERETGAALPLGGIVCRRDLPAAVVAAVAAAVSASLDGALANPEPTLATMRRHAQELSDEVLWKHVELYVNEHTRDLGEAGRQALDTLSDLARRHGLIPARAVLEIA